MDGPAPAPVSGESFACTLLADFFAAVNRILKDQEPTVAPMTIEEMITGLQAAGLDRYLGADGYRRLCAMIREDIPGMSGYTAEGRVASEMVPRQEPPAGTWDAGVPVTYSGKPRQGGEDSEVIITEPGEVRRVFTHYPPHPDDPDHRELTWGYMGSGPAATGALILNDALGSGTPGTIDEAGVMPGGIPFADAAGVRERRRGEVPPAGGLAADPRRGAGMGRDVAGQQRQLAAAKTDRRAAMRPQRRSDSERTIGRCAHGWKCRANSRAGVRCGYCVAASRTTAITPRSIGWRAGSWSA